MSILSEFREFIARGNVVDLAVGVICGLGPAGYGLALDHALRQLGDKG